MTVVREVMTKQLVTVEPQTSVAGAVTVMGMHRVGAVLVMEQGRMEGIFTERDLVRAMSYDIGASSQPGTHWMTRNPVTARHKTSIGQVQEIMLVRHFRQLPAMVGETL